MEKQKVSRSEKRFRKDLHKSVEEHKKKLEKGKLSLASGMGKLVIVVSNNFDVNHNSIPIEVQRKAFNEEAERLAEVHREQHEDVVIKRKADALDLRLDLSDEDITDLILIGHGSIGDFWLDDGGHFGWRDFAKDTKSLKQGRIIQRVCGHYALKDSVASGTFAVADQRNVIAPVGVQIPDINPDESLFVPVYDKPVHTYAELIDITNQRSQRR